MVSSLGNGRDEIFVAFALTINPLAPRRTASAFSLQHLPPPSTNSPSWTCVGLQWSNTTALQFSPYMTSQTAARPWHARPTARATWAGISVTRLAHSLSRPRTRPSLLDDYYVPTDGTKGTHGSFLSAFHPVSASLHFDPRSVLYTHCSCK